MFASAPGFQYLAITEPAIKKSFHRVAWAQFSDETDINEVVSKLDNYKVRSPPLHSYATLGDQAVAYDQIDTFTFHLGVNSAPTVGRTRVTAPIANTLSRLEKDAESAKALAERLEVELMGEAEADHVDEDDLEKEGEVNGDKHESKEANGEVVPMLRPESLSQRGSVEVQRRIDHLLESSLLAGDPDEEIDIRKVRFR